MSRSTLFYLVLIIISGLLSTTVYGQNIDPLFNPFIRTHAAANGMVVQSDGKVLVGGDIESVGYEKVPTIVRLTENGQLDKSYQIPYENWQTYGMSLDSKDRLYLIKESQGWRRDLTRLLANGTVDNQFLVDESIDHVNHITTQKDKCILVISHWDGNAAIERVLRLDENGNIDSSFKEYQMKDAFLKAAVQPDNKILIYGTNYQDNHPIMVRLHEDGKVDEAFQFSGELRGDYPSIANILAQKDGKYLVYGYFNFYSDIPVPGLVRLNKDGSFDNSFILPGPTANAFRGTLRSIQQLSSGKYAALGQNYSGEKGSFYRIIWLNEDGSLDNTLETYELFAAFNQYHWNLEMDYHQGQLFVSGGFSSVNNIAVKGTIAINEQGQLNTNFLPDLGGKPSVNDAVLTDDGSLIISGNFSEIDGVSTNSIAKLSSDGKVDEAFSSNISIGPKVRINTIALQPDGKVLVGGSFKLSNGHELSGIMRLKSNGKLDQSFSSEINNSGGGTTNIHLFEDGSMLVAGHSNYFTNTAYRNLIKLDSTGAVDYSFVPEVEDGVNISEMLVTEEGILIGGDRWAEVGSTGQYTNVGYINKLDFTGRADSTFSKEATVGYKTTALALTIDNNILAGGMSAGGYGSHDITPIIQMKPNGELIDRFSVGVGSYEIPFFSSIVATSDSTYILTGSYDRINRVARKGLSMFDLKGRVYNDFRFDLDGTSQGILFEDEGRSQAIVYGSFLAINDLSGFSGIARLNLKAPRAPSGLQVSIDESQGIVLQWQDSSDYEMGYRIYRSSENANGYELIDSVGADVTIYVDQNIDPATNYSYRVVSIGDGIVSGNSNAVQVSTSSLSIPKKPEGLNATWSNSSLYLNWNSPVDKVMGHYIERAKGDKFTIIDTVNVGYNYYYDTLANREKAYEYRIKAYNIVGESEYSTRIEYVPALVTSITEEVNFIEKVYPNPSSGVFTLEVDVESISLSTIQVYNTHGALYRDVPYIVGDKEVTVDISSYKTGVYFLVIKNQEGLTPRLFRLLKL
ncbi:T9SS type A sorting domain-containing protein [Tunicatimonas pelagia]|uniref:T9SS type A sorting domain-containing protein n=1 Tax=Tunicatimonas pelagia TaxID=931531 RepID=UPI0026660F69|nr:T9SS type A sorting domain-containing protein [Tunicatimonas pelagia]WKN42527.1 T9SS type A sorting domain-containing protein [Tunicatimonas pelagia]